MISREGKPQTAIFVIFISLGMYTQAKLVLRYNYCLQQKKALYQDSTNIIYH